MRVRVHYDDGGLADEWESEGIAMPEAERRRLDRDAEDAREWRYCGLDREPKVRVPRPRESKAA